MAHFKVQFVIGGGKSGWTESYYMEAATAVAAATALAGKAPERQGLMGPPYKIEAVRAAPVLTGTGPTAILNGPDAGGFGGYLPNVRANKADQANAAFHVQLWAVNGVKRQLWLRGVPDAWIERFGSDLNRFDLADPIMTGKLNDYVRVMTMAPRLTIRFKEPPGAGRRDLSSISEDDTSGQFKLTTTAAHGLAMGQSVVIKKVAGINVAGINGTHRVVAVPSATTLLINRYPLPTPAPVLQSAGYLYPVVYGYSEVASAVVIAASTRATGRPFGLRRGRRRTTR